MDFIHYSPTNELLILDKVSSDEMDIEEVALEYGYIERLLILMLLIGLHPLYRSCYRRDCFGYTDS